MHNNDTASETDPTDWQRQQQQQLKQWEQALRRQQLREQQAAALGRGSAQAHVLREHMMQPEPHGEQMQPQLQQQAEGERRLQQHLSNEHLQQRHQHYYPRALAAPSGYLLGADAAPAMNITCLV